MTSLQKESISEKLVRRDSDELRKNGEQLKAIRLQKESEWDNKECEVRWKEHGTFNVVCGAPYPCSIHTSKEERNKWIKELLSNRENEIAEEVEELKLPIPNLYGGWVKVERVNMILDKVLQILKH